MSAGNTIDGTVALNLRRLRTSQRPRKWSRSRLADEFNKHSAPGSRMWNEWRVLDLEDGRGGKPPSPILWHELVTLCVVFDVVLWELVLPADDQEVVVSTESADADGWSVVRNTFVDAGELGETLSGIPGEYLADRAKRERFTARFNDKELSVAKIIDQQRDLQETIDHLVESTSFVEVVRPLDDASDRSAGAEDSS